MVQFPDFQALVARCEATPLEPFKPAADYLAKEFKLWRSRFDLRENTSMECIFTQPLLREGFVTRYGFVLATAEVMDALATSLGHLGRVLDAGSGSGYLAAELARRGVDVLAVDSCDYGVPLGSRTEGHAFEQVHRQDVVGDALQYIDGHVATVLLVWPPHEGPFANQVADAMKRCQVLVYEGEGRGGCTADDDFFEQMSDEARWEFLPDVTEKLNESHIAFHGIHDRWLAWRRR